MLDKVLVFGPLVVTLAGILVTWLALRATERQRDEWKGAADELQLVVRSTPSLVQLGGAEVADSYRTLRQGQWDEKASRALHRYNALLEPEG